jgi:hypothetical protein
VGDLANRTIWDDPAIRIVATERVPAAPVNVMAQFHLDNFCDPASAKYRDKYPKFETTTFERDIARGMPAMFEN